MNILLINANPVVSRLLALCTRDDDISLHEVSESNAVLNESYDVLFVDEASYGRDISELVLKFPTAKKVFISYRNDEMRGFDLTIKKPFLPSQIIDIIQSTIHTNPQILEIDEKNPFNTKEEPLKQEPLENDDIPTIFPLTSEEKLPVTTVLNEDEIEKIKALLDMDDASIPTEEVLTDEALEARKIEVIKEQLMAEGLEIVDEHEIVDELSITLDGTLEKSKVKKNKPKKKKSKSKKIKFTEENMERIEDAVEMAMAHMTKKQMKHLLKGKKIELSVKLQELD